MEFKGITPDEVEAIVYAVGQQHYGDNLTVDWERRPKVVARGARWRGRIVPRSSYGQGARVSATIGRRQRAACWHAFRDVFGAIFDARPEARISTSLARYTFDNFLDTFPATAYENVGSQIRPITMPELCYCLDHEPARVLKTALPASITGRPGNSTGELTSEPVADPRPATRPCRHPEPKVIETSRQVIYGCAECGAQGVADASDPDAHTAARARMLNAG